MLHRLACLFLLLSLPIMLSAQVDPGAAAQEASNKQIALNFYRDLWGTNNTDRFGAAFGKG